jgi:D-beta-D-heptose 7-phosphate kinase / D-beta-D-heptose 1-phosphate adenosyltransferase
VIGSPRTAHLEQCLAKMAGKRAYVVGDAIVDHYEFGEVSRICPEAPVPVFVPSHFETRQGGAANVAANLSTLGLEVETTFAHPPWSVKRRYMAGSHLMLRVDEDHHGVLAADLEGMRETLKRAHVLVLSDYQKGTLTMQWCGFLIGAARSMGIPVVVDPKGTAWDKYVGCSVICPNFAEWERFNAPWHEGDPPTRPVFPAVLVKQGERGITILEYDEKPRHFPARARHVFDVTGAGDTVVAAVAGTLAAGGDLDSAAQIANAAAGVVVGEIGTSTCTPHQVLARLQEER